jgi:hypothetical protein
MTSADRRPSQGKRIPHAALSASSPLLPAGEMIPEQLNQLEDWQRQLIKRLERGISRPITDEDMTCVSWDPQGRTLTVQSPPLLDELRARNLISNVFRTFSSR